MIAGRFSAPTKRRPQRRGADGLTERERELLTFLREWPYPWGPTYRDMGRALGFAESNLTAPIAKMLERLEKHDCIRRRYGRRCSVEVLPPPIIIRGERYRFIPVGA